MSRPSRSAAALLRRAWRLAPLAALAACADVGAPVAPPEPEPAPPPRTQVAVLSCTAEVRARTVSCSDAPPAVGGRAALWIGGQGVNVRLASTNLAYDTATQVFAMDVTVQNLLVQRMGTPNGSTVTGMQVFFHSPPTASVGTGTVSVLNEDGEGLFTGADQPYFDYPEVLPLNAVSTPRRWRLGVPPSVERFVFQVYVQTDLLPVVVFDQVAGGNRDIYRAAIDGSDLVRLTSHVGDDQNPTASRGKVVFTSFRTGNAELYSVDLAGGVETRLTTTTASEVEPALSRDGRRLAFVSDAGGVAKIWASAPDGTGAARATPASFGFSGSPEAGPAWTPAGDRLSFVTAATGSSDIFAFTFPGGEPQLLVGGTRGEVEPAWSADGTRVAFVSNRDSDTELYLLTVASGAVTRLTTRAGSDAQPAWLSDGTLVYVSNRDGTPRLYRLDPAAPATTREIPLPAGAAMRPAGAPF